MDVTLEQARALIAHATEAANGKDLRVAAVVVDRGGHVVAAERMDGAYLTAMRIAERKAFTALNFGITTVAMRERIPKVEYQLQIQATDNRLAFLPGGAPLTADDGSVIGGFGISGASGAQDVDLCEGAIAALLSR